MSYIIAVFRIYSLSLALNRAIKSRLSYAIRLTCTKEAREVPTLFINEQDRQCACGITLWCVHVTIFAVNKAINIKY